MNTLEIQSMNKVQLASDLSISPIVHGLWRLRDWKLSKQELLKLTEQAIEVGITSFDHADIYGDYSCETLFGEALELKRDLRKNIQLVTKCGIKLLSEKYPERKVKIYDYSAEHILSSVNQSLLNLKTDYIDLLLLHRPSPFFNPEEVAEAFSILKKSGKVLRFGVSNFLPGQFNLLQACLDEKLVTNQIELSPFCLEHFQNGNLDFLQQEKIKPMAWSPLAGGELFSPKTEKGIRVQAALKEVSAETGNAPIDQIAYQWLLMHPAGIIPVVGSGKIDRIKSGVDAFGLTLSLEQWFKIYVAAQGCELP